MGKTEIMKLQGLEMRHFGFKLMAVIIISLFFYEYYNIHMDLGNDKPSRYKMPHHIPAYTRKNTSFLLPKDQLSDIYKPGSNRVKRILRWTTFWKHPFFGFHIGEEPSYADGCLLNKCEVTDNRTLLNESDAVVMHFYQVRTLYRLPQYHPPHQYWVYVNHEPPLWMKYNYSLYDSIFNLTISHIPDSDIPWPFGTLVPLTEDEKKAALNRKYAENKTDLVAWWVQSCETNSKREIYVKQLQKFIQVDIYGECGPLVCKRNAKECNDMLRDRYKFYLAFENTLCETYVTEKLWRTMALDVVPVVYGGADYDTILPKHSFINIKDFPSAKDLADYLLMLDQNDSLYNAYFEWRKFYRAEWPSKAQVLCNLCTYLHMLPDGDTKIKHNLAEWYGAEESCFSPDLYFNTSAS